METEVKNILKKLDDFYTQRRLKVNDTIELPKVGFIVVNKRTNTRLFQNDRGGFNNPKPGTVADSTITFKER